MVDVVAVLKVILKYLEEFRFSVVVGYTACVSGFLFFIGNLSEHGLHTVGLDFLITHRFLFFLVFCCALFIFVLMGLYSAVNFLKIRCYRLYILKDCDVCFFLLYMDAFSNERFDFCTNTIIANKLEKACFIESDLNGYFITDKAKRFLRKRNLHDRIADNAKHYAENYLSRIDSKINSKINSNIFIRDSASDVIRNWVISDFESDPMYIFSKKLLET